MKEKEIEQKKDDLRLSIRQEEEKLEDLTTSYRKVQEEIENRRIDSLRSYDLTRQNIDDHLALIEAGDDSSQWPGHTKSVLEEYSRSTEELLNLRQSLINVELNEAEESYKKQRRQQESKIEDLQKSLKNLL